MSEWIQQAQQIYMQMTPWQMFWLTVGFTGQILFGSRFIVQWIVSERAGRSIVPRVFWYLSIGGSLMLFTYATYRLDPVFMVGQGAGCFIYFRNLVLLDRAKGEGDASTHSGSKPA